MRLIEQKISATPAKKKSAPNLATAGRLFDLPAALRFPATPTILGNEKGVALVMALILGLVGMLMITSLLYMARTGIWTSGSKNRYHTALETTFGGMNFFTNETIQQGLGGTALSAMGNYGGMLTQVISDGNFIKKLTTAGNVTDGTYPANNPDVTLTFLNTAPTPTLIVNNAILSTSRGNSSLSGTQLVTGGVGEGSSAQTFGLHIPYLFQTETTTQQAINPREKARLSAMYSY